MLQLLPVAMDPRLIVDDEETSSSFGSEGDIHHPITEDSDSEGSIEEDDDSSVSDCESVVSGNRNLEHTRIIQPYGLVRLQASDRMHGIIEKKFLTKLDAHGVKAQVQNIHRNLFNTSAISQAKLRTFQIFSKAVEIKNGGDANIKYAWFGASKEEINNVILHGFGHENIQKNGSSFGYGVVLSADHSPLECLDSAIVDDDGTKHLLLCRVILGKSELVNPNSTQCHQSSDNFQSGVDDLVSPKKYFVWMNQMNTHILPEFVVSFKTPSNVTSESSSKQSRDYRYHRRSQLINSCDSGPRPNQVRIPKPASPWIPIPDLIAKLSKILPPKSMKEITQYRRSYIEHKISRREMILGIREFTGDRLLLTVLKDFTEQRKHGVPGR